MQAGSPVEQDHRPARATDAQIMVRSRRDPRAFATIFDRHHEAIYRFLAARVGDAADDLAAEVFEVAFERRDDYDPDYDSAKPWLFGIAANLVRRRRRRDAQRHDARSRMGGRRESSAVSPERRLHELAPGSPVARAVMDLPERDRDTLLLYVWGGMTYEEVARALDVPVGTVRSRIHRARGDLRERLPEPGPAARDAGTEGVGRG